MTDDDNDGGLSATRHIVHLVMLDEDVYSAFATVDRQKAEAAVEVLAKVLGYERVSTWSVVEDDLDAWQEKVAIWQSDPRINPTA